MKKIISGIFIFTVFVFCNDNEGETESKFNDNNEFSIEWESSAGGSNFDDARAVEQTQDGGFIIGGITYSDDGDVKNNKGGGDYWFVKLDGEGKLEWELTLGGSGRDEILSITETAQGDFIGVGRTSSLNGDVSKNNGKDDFWVVKVDSRGEIVWEKSFGGSEIDQATFVDETKNQDLIISGLSASSDGDLSGNNGGYDIWILRLSKDGEVVWEKNYGGESADSPSSIQETSDGKFVISGGTFSSNGDVSENLGRSDFWILKIDENGSIIWEESYGGSEFDTAFSVQETSDGGYIVSGDSQSSDGDVGQNNGRTDGLILKLNGTGQIMWKKIIGGTDSDIPLSIKESKNNGYFVTGFSKSSGNENSENLGDYDFWVLKLDDTGNVIWEKRLGGTQEDKLQSMDLTNDGGIIVAGTTFSEDLDVSISYGSGDFWIVKLR